MREMETETEGSQNKQSDELKPYHLVQLSRKGVQVVTEHDGQSDEQPLDHHQTVIAGAVTNVGLKSKWKDLILL